MNVRAADRVLNHALELVEGLHATEREPCDLMGDLSAALGRICGTDGTGIRTADDLRTVLTCAYHLGRRHALERVAIGLSDDLGASVENVAGDGPDCVR